MSIWKVDPAAVETRVGRHSWIRQVLVHREFPRRVVIEVSEREVRAIALLEKLYYVDADGFIFKPVEEGEAVDFPMMTGLQRAGVESRPAFPSREKIREAFRLADLMGKESFALSEIHFLRSGGLVLYPLDTPVALHMGWDGWEEKIQRLERVLELWKGKENLLAALDLSFRDQVVAKMKKVQGLKGSRVEGFKG
jgi:cell division protein FtsQ